MPSKFRGICISGTGCRGIALLFFIICGFLFSLDSVAAQPEPYAFLSTYLRDPLPIPPALLPAGPNVRQQTQETPGWKQEWDAARQAVRSSLLEDAASRYRHLLEVKDVEEARWELASVLMIMGRLREAFDLVEILYDAAPDRSDYGKALAHLLLQMGRYKTAGEMFYKIAAREPDNSWVLAGAVQSFLEEGREKEALPLLERLWDQDKENHGLQRKLAFVAYGQQEDSIGIYHLRQLAEEKNVDPEILLLAAKTCDRLKLPQEAVLYWKRLLALCPDFLEAHLWLALYFQEGGRVEEALPHLLFLNERQPDNYDLLKRIGQCYVGQQEFAQALKFFERVIELVPKDKDAVRFVVNIHAALGNKAETLKALEHYFAIESHPGAESLKKAAALYDEAGYAGQAIEVYRRLLEVSPDDSAILVSLAKNFLEVGNAEEALTVWKKLAQIAPDVLPVYRSMADLMEKLGRRHELLNVLEIIHELDPADQKSTIKLAEHYFENGNAAESLSVLSSLAGAANLPPLYYYLRGQLHFQSGEYVLAVSFFEKYLLREPEDSAARLQCLVAAGHIGDIVVLKRHQRLLMDSGVSVTAAQQFQIAEALYSCGEFGEAAALFQQQVDLAMSHFQESGAPSPQDPFTAKNALRLSDIYKEQGLLYDAEQALRIGFVLTGETALLERLFQIALRQGDFDAARQWLAAFRKGSPQQTTRPRVMEARLLLGLGERTQAAKLARSLVRDLYKNFGADGELHAAAQPGDKIALAALLAETGEDANAERLCLSLLKQTPSLIEAKAILAKISRKRGKALLSLPEIQGLTSSELLVLAGYFKEYGLYASMGQAAQRVRDEVPQSLRARLFIAQAFGLQGQKEKAKTAWRELAADYPDRPYVLTELARQFFLTGELDAAMEVSERLLGTGFRPDIVLMQARILWRQNNWGAAIRRYDAVREPAVATLLAKEAEALHFALPTPELQRSFWEFITGTPGRSFSSALTEKVMAVPTFLSTLSSGNRRFTLEAAKLYALSRWQEQFEAELLVRHAVKRGEYYVAQKLYESFLDRYPAENVLLYDLAGVYSRQGDLGKEAAAYEELLAENIDFEELRNAMERNRLKQKPRVTALAGFQSEEGKNDHKDIEKEWQQLSLWYSPHTRQEMEIDLSRINYESVARQDVSRSVRALASYKSAIVSGVDITLGVGIESLDSGDANTALLALEATGKLGDKLTGTITFDRDVVADTVASLSRQIVQQKMRGGISFEPLSRLAVGGDYEVREYSDNNWTTGYDFWSSYVLLSEPTFLQAFYRYDFKESREGAVPGQLQSDGFAADDHPYWAPKNYWENEFGLQFKHYLSSETLDRGTPKYYTAQYSFGHDSDGYGFQNVAGNFFIEMTTHLLVKASLDLSSSPTYRKKQFVFSASYRW